MKLLINSLTKRSLMMKNFILLTATLLSLSNGFANDDINLKEIDSLLCKSQARPSFSLFELQSENPRYKSSSNGVKINIIKVSELKVTYKLLSSGVKETISIEKIRENDEGSIRLVGTHSDDMGNSSFVECEILD
jgi:hypothetical protein